MRYYFLRLLSVTKRALGYLMSQIAKAYNRLGETINAGIIKEEAKIEQLKQRNIDRAKQAVVDAARVVLEAEKNVDVVATKESDKAHKKLVKLNTKVQ